MNKIKIGIVEDQKLFREGISVIIRAETEFELVFAVENAADLLERLNQPELHPEIILLDMSLPDMNGIEINDLIHKQYPSIKTIILTAYDQPRYIARLIENGANSFLSKNSEPEELVLAIKTVHHTGFYFNKTIVHALQSEVGKKRQTLTSINGIPIELTNREMEILVLICKEYSTEEIANKLFVSVRTIDGHRTNILDKTGCKNVAGLVIFAITHHLFTPLK